MAVNLEQAQAAVDAAQKAYDDAIKSGKVRDAANASKALSAAKRNLEAAKQGVDTAGKTRKDILKEQRAKEFTRRAEERAKTETPAFYLAPEGSKIKGYDITYRPQAPESKDGMLFFYSWVGGATTGSWKLYRAPATQENIQKYGSRSVGGKTQAKFGTSSEGANALERQPLPVLDSRGNITGYKQNPKTGMPTSAQTPSGAVTPSGSTRTPTGTTPQSPKKDSDFGPDVEEVVDTSGITATTPYGEGDITVTLGPAFDAGPTAAEDYAKERRQSAYDLLYEQFRQYGLEGLVTPLKGLIESNVSPAEFTLRLRETDAYKKRFAANQSRVQKGLRALSEAEYIGLEDQYQDVMRRYGLPESYYTRGDMGRQEGFEKFLGGDVSPVELEDRIQTAQRRVINANPQIAATLRQFYPEVGQGDLLAYFLDPEKAIENIKRKVTAAEIGGAATVAGLTTGLQRAEELAGYGVTGEAARQGFQTVAGVLPRGGQLAEFYKQSPYTQATAEQEVFGLAGATEAEKQRRKLAQLESAAFSGQTGMAGGALARERAGQF
jgi:hypothetical protein